MDEETEESTNRSERSSSQETGGTVRSAKPGEELFKARALED